MVMKWETLGSVAGDMIKANTDRLGINLEGNRLAILVEKLLEPPVNINTSKAIDDARQEAEEQAVRAQPEAWAKFIEAELQCEREQDQSSDSTADRERMRVAWNARDAILLEILHQGTSASNPPVRLSTLNLNWKVVELLRNDNIIAVDDLRTEASLLTIPGFGKKSLEKVKAALKELGIELPKR
jgi:DNA-directed RNA polymerase alpha subunit